MAKKTVRSLPVGKLPNELLKRFLDRVRIEDKQVVLTPAIGEDAAVIRVGNKLLVAKTDPVTLASDHIGWYAVHINANDVATRGVRPRWFMASVLLPEQSTQKDAERILDQILSACDSLEVSLVGGHTEITYGLKHPIIIGCMLAETGNGPIITTSGARAGDDIVLTKGLAIEGTAALAREAKQALLAAKLGKELVQRAAAYLFNPGISVMKEAHIASSKVKVNSMHDPTEGGLSTGLWEIATAAKVGMIIEEDKIPVLPECKAICERLALNPLGLLASGALIITLPPAETPALLAALAEAKVNASIIGKVANAEEGLKMRSKGETRELPQFERDELARFLESQDSKKEGEG